MTAAMALREPDRVPLMCQLSIGHLLLTTGISPVDLWFTAEGCASAWIEAQRRYRFDGILLNLCGPPRDILPLAERIETDADGNAVIHWKAGAFPHVQTVCPPDDLPYNVFPGGEPHSDFSSFDPERDLPARLEWMPVSQSMRVPIDPESKFDALRIVRERTGGSVSLHGEVFSPWDYHLALFGVENALMAIMEDAGKVRAILDRLADLCAAWAVEQVREGVDAITLASPWAGGGFISRAQYREFVLPYERRVNRAIREAGAFCCTHTCGRLGDRLDLLMESETHGIECLDPPPLGNVELADAKAQTAGRAFIKGNIDSVNVLLNGTDSEVRRDVIQRIETGKPGGGFILSTACSVAPRVPPERLELLYELVEEHGRY